MSMQAMPPIRPPMWPPIEMFESAKLKMRLITIRPIALPPRTYDRCRSNTSAAPRIPKIAPGARGGGGRGRKRGGPRRAREARGEIDHQEPRAPQVLLDRCPDQVEE